MYNGAIIRALLKERKLKIKDLLDGLNMNTGGGLRPLEDADPKASKLEELADFFGVSIDTFFIRDKRIELLETVNEMLKRELEEIKNKITAGQVTDK